MRAILIRDHNKMISTAVLSSPKVSEQEAAGFARMASLSEDVLRAIGGNRAWLKNYGVVLGLTKNPRTPLAISLNLMSRLQDRDLSTLSVESQRARSPPHRRQKESPRRRERKGMTVPFRSLLGTARLSTACFIVTGVIATGFAAAVPVMRPGAQMARLKPPDVKFVPTPQSVVVEMLNLAKVTQADVVYDLGSGDGRIPITAAKEYGARGVGIEIDWIRIREANDDLKKAGVGDRVTFVTENMFDADISGATVVTLFLGTRINQKLMPKLQRELRRGARIVSFQFDMGDAWPPDQSRDVDNLTIYLWTIR